MQIQNSRQSYGWLSIALHWLGAAAMLYLLWTGFNSHWAEEAGDRATHHAYEELHISFGATVIFLLLARVAASYAQPRPAPIEQAPAFRWLALATQQALLIAILVQIVTGPLIEWVNARPIEVWDWFSIASPFAERHREWHNALKLVHSLDRWVILGLIVLHTLGALKHAMIDRDGVMRRMLVAGAPKS